MGMLILHAGGEGDYRNRIRSRHIRRTYAGKQFEAVHAGHLYIRDNSIEGIFLQQAENGERVGTTKHLDMVLPQVFFGKGQLQRIVVHQQAIHVASRKDRGKRLRCLFFFFRRRKNLHVRHRYRKLDREITSFSDDALQRKGATHQHRHLAGDG